MGNWDGFCFLMLGCLFMFVSGIEYLSSYLYGIFTHKLNSNNGLGIDREIVVMNLCSYSRFLSDVMGHLATAQLHKLFHNKVQRKAEQKDNGLAP